MCKFSGHLVGKVALVTGANTGIGFEAAKDLAQRGARVILACRNLEKGAIAKEKIIQSSANNNIHLLHLDLASLASVRTFVANVLNLTERLDILINNAGAYGTGREKTEDGLVIGMQINYFAPFLLTSLLLPLLKKSAPSRIVNVSSMLHKFGKIDFDNLNMEKESNRWSSLFTYKVYCNSKFFTLLATTELAFRLKDTGVTVNSLHPGSVNTNIMSQSDIYFIRLFLKSMRGFHKTPWEGAQTIIFLSVSPEVENVSGYYFEDCRSVGPCSSPQYSEIVKKLWDVSEELVKL